MRNQSRIRKTNQNKVQFGTNADMSKGSHHLDPVFHRDDHLASDSRLWPDTLHQVSQDIVHVEFSAEEPSSAQRAEGGGGDALKTNLAEIMATLKGDRVFVEVQADGTLQLLALQCLLQTVNIWVGTLDKGLRI